MSGERPGENRLSGPVVVTMTLPIRTASLANRRVHWAEKARIAKRERLTTRACWLKARGCPLVEGETAAITLTRVAPHALDEHDGLRDSLKSVVDELADCLGFIRRDNNPRLSWAYKQRRGQVREYLVEVTVEIEAAALEHGGGQ